MSTRKKVMVVGAGTIGARHAQAMARVKAPIDLDIVDPLPQARQHALSLLAVAGGLNGGSVHEFGRLDDLEDAPDLAIIATNSRERPAAIRAVVALGARSLILEKVLFTRLSDYDAIDQLFADSGISAWVNCVNGAYPRSGRVKELIGDSPFHYRVEGTAWGLCCNLIHHLDEFCALSGQKNLQLNSAGLEPIVAQSKRSGYVEFFGHVSGETAGPTKFTATCQPGPDWSRTITIDLGDRSLAISGQVLTIRDSHGSRTEPYPITLQSEMTDAYVDAIFAGKSPQLPDYATASGLHRTMVTALLEHLRRVRLDASLEECPVT